MLSTLKILDFTTLLPGPFATMLLADLGADVLRVEAPQRPDLVRNMPPFDGDTSAWHGVLNRNKRSLALDLKRPGVVEVVKRLVGAGGYDIVIEQFRPGVMARLGLDDAALRAVNPALIYCSITGYGQTGPLRHRAGHDINYVALSGVMSHSGRRAEGPAPLGVQLADVGGGALGALVGLLAAVIQRQATGVGQRVDVSMFDMLLAWQAHVAAEYLVGGQVPQPEGMALNGGGFYDVYATADGRFLSVGSLEPKFWQGFCAAIERPDLAARGYDPDPAAQQALKAELRTVLAQRPLAEWQALFAALDVCVEPALTLPEALAQPHTQARDMLVDVPKPDGRTQRQVGTPLKFSAGEPRYRHVGAPLGAHTNEVLAEIGYNPNQIQTLRAAGAFGG
jgi:alpha-methylacyl-CoA racemase